MKNVIKNFAAGICLVFALSIQITHAQTTHKKPAAKNVVAVLARQNYIAHEITKIGAGDNGIYYDTVASKMKPADPINAAGKQYQDIKVNLEAGDVIISNLSSGRQNQSLSLLSDANGHLSAVKATIDTSRYYKIKLSYKATLAGTYLLRITSKIKVPKATYDWQYYYANSTSYSVNSIISTQSSGVINSSPGVCGQIQFLLRQRLTSYMQITGAISDTTMDVLDKKKIGFINHLSTFTFYENSKAKVSIDPAGTYITFDQALFYKDKADALKAQQYFIQLFENCLGEGWVGDTDSSDPNWYKFTKKGQGDVNIILYPEYNYVQILM